MNQNTKRHLVGPLGVGIITLIVSLLLMSTYVHRCLMGNVNYHMLTAKMFGIPQPLRDQGLDEFYRGKVETGWDGQFYYFMANDLLGSPETVSHIDRPAYRYQRIGLPLIARGLATLTGQSWVSPKTYYATSLILVCLASWLLARYFAANGLSPLFALSWSIGVGTQLTSVNGLPDAAADSLLAMALLALFDNRIKTYAVLMSLAVLSREAYLLFPLLIGLARLVQTARRFRFADESLQVIKAWFTDRFLLVHALPVAIFVAWQTYIRLHFQVNPSSQADGILAWPLITWWRYFVSGIEGRHLLLPGLPAAHWEAALLVLFAALLCFGSWFVYRSWRVVGKAAEVSGVILASAALVAMYASFGPTVIMHYTGYLKAANVFLLLIPLMAAATRIPMSKGYASFAVVFFLLSSTHLINDRYKQPASVSFYTRDGDITEALPAACLKDVPPYQLTLAGFDDLRRGGAIARLVQPTDRILVVKVKNLSTETFTSRHAMGSINLGAQVVPALAKQGPVLDNFRSLFAVPLKPGEEVSMSVLVANPRTRGQYDVIVSLVQEGCAWFYQVDPTGALKIPLTVR